MTAEGGADVVVVDASLAAMWVLPETYSPLARALARDWARAGIQAVAPCFMVAEVSNAIYKRVRRGELSLSQAQEAMDVVQGFGVRLVDEPGLQREAVELAHRLNRPTTYDAQYLILGQVRQCEVWTGDERLYNAVRTEVPRLRWVGAYVSQAVGS